jgi:hypothetical protein
MKALLVLAALASVAHADPELHAAGGLELEGGDGVTSIAFRAHLLLGQEFGSGTWRPDVAVGGTLGAGNLIAPDVRGLDGTVTLSNVAYGPEAQLGLQYHGDDHVNLRFFFGLAYLRDKVDDRVMIDAVPNVAGGTGWRASVGLNVAHAIDLSGHDDTGMMMIFLPQQFEVVSEQDGGSHRWGFALAWGI